MDSHIQSCLDVLYVRFVDLEGMFKLKIVQDDRLILNESVFFHSLQHVIPSCRLKYAFVQSDS